MSKYYYVDHTGTQCGPVEESELQQCGVTGNSLVWRRGMKEWRPAREVIGYFNQPQQPMGQSFGNPQPPMGGSMGGPQQPMGQSFGNPQPPMGGSMGGGQQPMGNPANPYQDQFNNMGVLPDNYMLWAILVTILCNVICGAIAIYYASRVHPLWQMGNQYGAIKSQKNVKTWCLIGVGLTFVGVFIYFIFILLQISAF